MITYEKEQPDGSYIKKKQLFFKSNSDKDIVNGLFVMDVADKASDLILRHTPPRLAVYQSSLKVISKQLVLFSGKQNSSTQA